MQGIRRQSTGGFWKWLRKPSRRSAPSSTPTSSVAPSSRSPATPTTVRSKAFGFLKSLPAFLFWLVGVGIGCILIYWLGLLVLTLADWAVPDDPKTLIPPGPPPLSVAEQDALLLDHLHEAQANGWSISPDVTDVALDRRNMPKEVTTLNLAYAPAVNLEIVGGYTGRALLEYRIYPATEWTLLRPDVSRDLSNFKPAILQLRSTSESLTREQFREQQVLAHAIRNPSDALVLRTERVIKAGEAVVWARVPTQLGDKPLTAQLKIVILKNTGEAYPLSTLFNAPLDIFVGQAWGQCVHPVLERTMSLPTTADNRLIIGVPPNFGDDPLIMVNWKIY